MKQSLYLFALSGLLWIGCHANKQNTTATPDTATPAMTLTGQKWKLIEINGEPVADQINNKEPFIEFSSGTENRYAASGGCNGLGGTYTTSGTAKIKFSQGMSTMMACADMNVENQLKKVFGTADNYTIANNILSLNKARMAPLARFQAVATDPATALNGTWELNYISGPRIAFSGLYPNKKPTLVFNLPDTIATGNSSCNNFRVAFRLQEQGIQFRMPMSTKMACEGQGETIFFKTLQTVSQFSLTGQTLTLIMGDIAVMRFQKKK